MENSQDFSSKQKRFEITTQMPLLPHGYPISARVIADSTSEYGVRLTTFELVFPRYVLAELATHRVFSKNASSSRAIPTKKLIKEALENMVLPVRFGKNQSGMQAAKENLTGEALEEAIAIWRNMAAIVAQGCTRLAELGLHKQWASRPVEWFSTIKVVLTATEFDNFFLLRDHFEAQDEICYLAQAVKVAMNSSTPKLVGFKEWHLPYVSQEELSALGLNDALKVSASRCARTSYKTHHGVTSTLEDDIELFKKLVHDTENDENPFHASPTEHQATPCVIRDSKLTGNFREWQQHRKYIEKGLIKHFP